ncbi:MAG: DUF4838 domain-containing protein [Chthoniobacteraceae bacterium]
MTSAFQAPARLALCFSAFVISLLTGRSEAQVTLTSNGQPQAVILTKIGPLGSVTLAAQELQEHIQRMSGATLPIDVVGTEANYPGKKFIYVGPSSAATAAGISTAGLDLEFYVIRTVGPNLYIVGRDGGEDDWSDLTDCQPGTLLGTYHLLGEIMGVRWLWPGESGRFVPANPSITLPALSITTGPAMVQRKYRTPRIGTYLNGLATYGFGVPVLPTSNARKLELAYDELRWLRRMRMGTRKSPSFGHSFTQWWTTYGTTHPEYFAELLPGKTQPHPGADRVKLHDSSMAVYQQRVNDWVAAGAGNSLNICPNDSRSFCVCAACRALDRPAQAADVVFDSSAARLSDRLATFYTEIANRVKLINPNALVYGYAYDVYRYAPLEANLPSNVALAYIPGAPSDTLLDGIAETEANVLGWITHGCTQMYLRPNWMLSAHCGPEWPTHRVGEHFKRLLASGNIKGFDSDSTCGSYASFGLYYYLICRLIADPTLPVDTIVDEYCSAFGSASGKVRDYFTYWENFINNQADAGNTDILGYASCVPAYGSTYSDYAFDGALQILDSAYALLGAGETAARSRLDFLKIACLHGRLTAQAIALVSPTLPLSSNPQAEKAMRALLAYRDQNAESFAVWREWMIDRESNVSGMQAYWTSILANPDAGYGSNVGTFIELGGLVVMEAEHSTASSAGTGTAAGGTWQDVGAIAGSSGSVMQALPNTGVATDTGTNGPRLDFKVDFHTAGTYFVFLHMPHHASGQDDSVNIGLDGALVASNLGNTSGSWRWRTTTPTTVGLNITTPGVHTFHIWMREDGVVVDKVILTTNASFTLPGTDLGPVESGKRGTTERLLTVGNGTGDGYYGESSVIAITANAAPAGYVFDRWTGATAALSSTLSATATVLMPSQDTTIAATYRVAPTLDTDGDGIPDAWELAHFPNLNTASGSPLSDFDDDGTSDLAEFVAGTLPDDPQSQLKVEEITTSANGDVTVRWQAVAGKKYTIETTAALDIADWKAIAIGIPATAPLSTYTVHFSTPQGFLRVRVE